MGKDKQKTASLHHDQAAGRWPGSVPARERARHWAALDISASVERDESMVWKLVQW